MVLHQWNKFNDQVWNKFLSMDVQECSKREVQEVRKANASKVAATYVIEADKDSSNSVEFDSTSSSSIEEIVSNKGPSKALLKWYEHETDEDEEVFWFKSQKTREMVLSHKFRLASGRARLTCYVSTHRGDNLVTKFHIICYWIEMTTSSTNNSVFRSFFEKQKHTGPNFIDWYRQLMFVLSIEDKLHYLEQPIPLVSEAPEGQQVSPEILKAHNAWIKGSKEIVGIMLMKQELLQTTRDFHSYKQEEGQSVSSYVLKMNGYIDNLERLGHPVTLGLGGLRASRKLKPEALSLYVGNDQREVVEAISAFYLYLPSGLEIVLNNCHYASSITRGVIFVSRLYEDGKKRIEKLQHDGLLNSSDLRAFEKCVSCMSGKMARKPYTHQVEKAKDLLGQIHTDVCGPFKIMSRQGASYFVTFTGDFSRYGYVYLLKHKHEVYETFKVFQKEVENQLERKNITLLDMVRSMMSQTTLRKSFWDYALETAARILNMAPTKKGCEALIKQDTLTKPDKLEAISIKYIFVGYPKETMGYSFYYPPKNKVLIARNAKFLENSLIDQEVSGSLEDLKIIQEEDTHPSLDTSLNHEEDDLEIDEPQSDIVPIHRSTRTRQASDLSGSSKKTDMDGNVHIYKARLVAKGYTQTLGIDYEKTFSPVADIRAIRILIAIAAYYDYEIWQMDVKTTFLNGYLNEEHVEKKDLKEKSSGSIKSPTKQTLDILHGQAGRSLEKGALLGLLSYPLNEAPLKLLAEPLQKKRAFRTRVPGSDFALATDIVATSTLLGVSKTPTVVEPPQKKCVFQMSTPEDDSFEIDDALAKPKALESTVTTNGHAKLTESNKVENENDQKSRDIFGEGNDQKSAKLIESGRDQQATNIIRKSESKDGKGNDQNAINVCGNLDAPASTAPTNGIFSFGTTTGSLFNFSSLRVSSTSIASTDTTTTVISTTITPIPAVILFTSTPTPVIPSSVPVLVFSFWSATSTTPSILEAKTRNNSVKNDKDLKSNSPFASTPISTTTTTTGSRLFGFRSLAVTSTTNNQSQASFFTVSNGSQANTQASVAVTSSMPFLFGSFHPIFYLWDFSFFIPSFYIIQFQC
nr:hypothetical protein [Tanacetum cinerariifolium]